MDQMDVQGGPSGRGIQFVDIKFKVLRQYELLMLKRKSYFNVNKSLSATRWTTLYYARCAKSAAPNKQSGLLRCLCEGAYLPNLAHGRRSHRCHQLSIHPTDCHHCRFGKSELQRRSPRLPKWQTNQRLQICSTIQSRRQRPLSDLRPDYTFGCK